MLHSAIEITAACIGSFGESGPDSSRIITNKRINYNMYSTFNPDIKQNLGTCGNPPQALHFPVDKQGKQIYLFIRRKVSQN